MTIVSFEFFPPKTPEMEQKLWDAVTHLAPLNPAFVSVTYGAGGSTRERTHHTVKRILDETNLIPAAHLTCVAAGRAEVDSVAKAYWDAGVRHIVALRGDMPEGGAFKPHPEGYRYSCDLVAGLKQIGDFEISVAAFPEKHPESKSFDEDIAYLKKKIKMHMDAAEVNAETRASGELARQVKHDIRSPLAALNNTIKSLVLPADKKSVIQSAISRINDIADDLNRTKATSNTVRSESSVQSQQNLGEILASVIEEKRIQYRDLPEIAFELHLDSAPDLGSVAMDSKELKRILSNVLNNSVEATEDVGLIKIELSGEHDFARVFIVDTGKGIPPEVIPSLGAKGKTFDKQNGSGLGLYHAISTIEGVGGRFTIDSDGISGTCVEILIPLAANPIKPATKIL